MICGGTCSMSNKLVCPICGDVTSSYMGNYRKDRLCKKHATDLRNGKLVKCENCNEWHYVNESCKCKKQFLQNCLLAVLTNALHVGQKQRATPFVKNVLVIIPKKKC